MYALKSKSILSMAIAMAVSTSAYANDETTIEEVTVVAKPTSYANNVIEPAMLE